jgi:hypothetical protein
MATQDGNPNGGGHYNTPDFSGLQFDDTLRPAPGLEVDYRANEAIPEAVYKADPFPEKSPNVGVYPAPPYYQAAPNSHGPEVVPASGMPPLPPLPTEPKGHSKKFWVLVGTGVALVVIIAVVVGCVVGLVVVPNNKNAES